MGKGSKQTTTSRQQYELPPYMRDASMDAVSKARDISNRAYTPYEGQRIADLSQNERMGVDMARSNVGAWQGDFQSARDALGRIQSSKDPGALQGYMNPYLEQVLQPAARKANLAFESERAQRQATAGMRGAFGGRSQIYDSRLGSEHEQNMQDLYGKTYAAAFENAQRQFNTEQDRYINQAGAYQNLGAGAAEQRRGDLRDLMQTGLTERTRDQADLDFQYLQHLEKRDWDVNNLDTLIKTLSSVPHEYSTSGEQTTTKQDSPLKALSGIAAITAGAIMTGGASLAAGGSFWGAVGDAFLTGGMGSMAGGEG